MPPLDDMFRFLQGLPPEVIRVTEAALVLLAAGLLYRYLSHSINLRSHRFELDAHTQNSLRLVLRVVTIIVVTTTLFAVFNIPADWFVGGSALIGAVVGFGSSTTINNVAAGFYMAFSRPFRVKDYVKIGDVEGEVEEISINYTRLYTPGFSMMLIPNTQVITNRVLNYTSEGMIKYLFTLTFPHVEGLPDDAIMARCFEPAFDEFLTRHANEKLRRPEHFFDSTTAFGRTYKIRVFAPKGEARRLFVLQPELASLILQRWDTEKTRVASKPS